METKQKYEIREVTRRPYGTYFTYYQVIDTEVKSQLARHNCKGEFATREEAQEEIDNLNK